MTEDVKFLGLFVDEHLNFSQHVSKTCIRTSKSIGVMYKLRSFLPVNIMKTLYHALINPYLRYSTESW